MKLITRQLSSISVATVGVIALAMPSVSALGIKSGTTTVSTTSASTNTSQFCSKLATYSSTINSKVSSLEAAVSQAWTSQDQKLAATNQSVTQRVAQNRQNADSRRQADFAKLMAKAKTGTQQQAVTAYEDAVNSAVTIRRAAYDAARQTFASGVAADINTRHSTISGQAASFQTSVNSALSTAQSSCTSNASGDSVRTAFVDSLRSARQTYQSGRASDNKVKTQVQQLAATRDSAFRTADKAFQSSLESARQTLDKAFKSSV